MAEESAGPGEFLLAESRLCGEPLAALRGGKRPLQMRSSLYNHSELKGEICTFCRMNVYAFGGEG